MAFGIAFGIVFGVVFTVALFYAAFLGWAVLKLSKVAKEDDMRFGRKAESDAYYRRKIVGEVKERIFEKLAKFVLNR